MHTAMLTALMAEVADAVGEEGDAILIAAVHRVLQIVAPNPN
jgi:acid phosphatase family membrane protein YuiD